MMIFSLPLARVVQHRVANEIEPKNDNYTNRILKRIDLFLMLLALWPFACIRHHDILPAAHIKFRR